MSRRPVHLDEDGWRALVEMVGKVDKMGLDETVYDVAEAHAADVNNGGVGDQVTYLLDAGWSAEEILAAAKKVGAES